MKSDLEISLQNEIQNQLGKLTNQLENALASLINYAYPSEVYLLLFQIFPYNFTSEFPIRVFFIDKNNCEYFIYINDVAEYPSPIDPCLIETEGIYPNSLLNKYKENDLKFDYITISCTEAMSWFYTSWKNMGGEQFKLLATIMIHDDNIELDLKTGKTQPAFSNY